ncbi:MAG TPA: hypothetical protein VKB19_01740 [Pedobacter sp.]|nr:hypothetical protein [Pedobacter sp.]
MEHSINRINLEGVLLDFSQADQIVYWADKLNITPEMIKSAARACHNNTLDQIISYLKSCSKLSKDFVVS